MPLARKRNRLNHVESWAVKSILWAVDKRLISIIPWPDRFGDKGVVSIFSRKRFHDANACLNRFSETRSLGGVGLRVREPPVEAGYCCCRSPCAWPVITAKTKRRTGEFGGRSGVRRACAKNMVLRKLRGERSRQCDSIGTRVISRYRVSFSAEIQGGELARSAGGTKA
jgi:hypothetical protein